MDGYPQHPAQPVRRHNRDARRRGEDETDDEKPFAQVGDLEARWHALTGDERTRAETLLQDASDLIRTTCPPMGQRQAGHVEAHRLHGRQTSHAGRPRHVGRDPVTQTAGSYSESLSYANPAGDLYLTTSEKEALGGDGEAWSYDMAGGAA